MAMENEEMSLAVCNLLQAIIDALSGEDKREHRGKEEALVLGRRYSPVLVHGDSKREPPYAGISCVQRCRGLILVCMSGL